MHPQLDIHTLQAIVALSNPLELLVAAHGILGQGFDGVNIEGKKDDYIPNATGVCVTSAQGGGCSLPAHFHTCTPAFAPLSLKIIVARTPARGGFADFVALGKHLQIRWLLIRAQVSSSLPLKVKVRLKGT